MMNSFKRNIDSKKALGIGNEAILIAKSKKVDFINIEIRNNTGVLMELKSYSHEKIEDSKGENFFEKCLYHAQQTKRMTKHKVRLIFRSGSIYSGLDCFKYTEQNEIMKILGFGDGKKFRKRYPGISAMCSAD